MQPSRKGDFGPRAAGRCKKLVLLRGGMNKGITVARACHDTDYPRANDRLCTPNIMQSSACDEYRKRTMASGARCPREMTSSLTVSLSPAPRSAASLIRADVP